jgi:hypothetical protein
MSRHKLEATRRITAASFESVTPLQATNESIVETSRALQNNSSKQQATNTNVKAQSSNNNDDDKDDTAQDQQQATMTTTEAPTRR